MAKQNTESEDDFLTMQQEAIRRVREMQSRARATLENAGMHIENNDAPDFTPTQANIGRSQTSSTSRTFSDNVPSNAPHSDNTQSNNTHSDNTHSTDTRSNAPHYESARAAASHYDEPRSNNLNHGAQQTNFMHASVPHQNQRPEEENVPSHGELNLLKMTGLNLALDSDQLLILATLYLLVKDGGDKWLILSLAYILLT